MKTKNIPADIKIKSIKEAQNEIKEILTNLENSGVNLEESVDKYNTMMHINNHNGEQFKKKLKEIKNSNTKYKKTISKKT